MTHRFILGIALALSLTFVGGVFMAVPSVVMAQDGGDIELFAPLPGEDKEKIETIEAGSFEEGEGYLFNYIKGLYAWVFVLAGALAVLMVVIGGYQVMMSGAVTTVEEGKQRILNAVSGIILLLLSGLLLYTINPQAFDALRGGEETPASSSE